LIENCENVSGIILDDDSSCVSIVLVFGNLVNGKTKGFDAGDEDIK
jgi:hypothetical protein